MADLTTVQGQGAAVSIAGFNFRSKAWSGSLLTNPTNIAGNGDLGFDRNKNTISRLTYSTGGVCYDTSGIEIAGCGGSATLTGFTGFKISAWDYVANVLVTDTTGFSSNCFAECMPAWLSTMVSFVGVGTVSGAPFDTTILTAHNDQVASVVLQALTGMTINIPTLSIASVNYSRPYNDKLIVSVTGMTYGPYTMTWATNAPFPTLALSTGVFDASKFIATTALDDAYIGGAFRGFGCQSVITSLHLHRSNLISDAMTYQLSGMSTGTVTYT